VLSGKFYLYLHGRQIYSVDPLCQELPDPQKEVRNPCRGQNADTGTPIPQRAEVSLKAGRHCGPRLTQKHRFHSSSGMRPGSARVRTFPEFPGPRPRPLRAAQRPFQWIIELQLELGGFRFANRLAFVDGSHRMKRLAGLSSSRPADTTNFSSAKKPNSGLPLAGQRPVSQCFEKRHQACQMVV
jgi:hypothetical protein